MPEDIDRDRPYDMSSAAPTVRTAYRPSRETARALWHALKLAFTPHARNSALRKRATTVLFVTWGAVTILRAAGHGPHDDQVYWIMTIIVASIISHLWGFEYGLLSQVTVTLGDDDDGDREDR